MFKTTPILVTINNISLNYLSDGDTNDVFYFIGTSNNKTSFTNPQSISIPITVQVNMLSGGSALSLTDRSANGLLTTDSSNSNVVINLGNSRTLVLNKYSIRSRNIGTAYIRNWKLQGSNNGSTWTDLDTQINNTTITAVSGWVSITVTGITIGYQYFRLLHTGLNSGSNNMLNLGEIQLYGNYTYSN